jgi:hypothetical protein
MRSVLGKHQTGKSGNLRKEKCYVTLRFLQGAANIICHRLCKQGNLRNRNKPELQVVDPRDRNRVRVLLTITSLLKAERVRVQLDVEQSEDSDLDSESQFSQLLSLTAAST